MIRDYNAYDRAIERRRAASAVAAKRLAQSRQCVCPICGKSRPVTTAMAYLKQQGMIDWTYNPEHYREQPDQDHDILVHPECSLAAYLKARQEAGQ